MTTTAEYRRQKAARQRAAGVLCRNCHRPPLKYLPLRADGYCIKCHKDPNRDIKCPGCGGYYTDENPRYSSRHPYHKQCKPKQTLPTKNASPKTQEKIWEAHPPLKALHTERQKRKNRNPTHAKEIAAYKESVLYQFRLNRKKKKGEK